MLGVYGPELGVAIERRDVIHKNFMWHPIHQKFASPCYCGVRIARNYFARPV